MDRRHDPRPPDVPPAAKPRRRGPFGFILGYTRGLIANQHLRRLTMFYVVIADMIMFFAGVTFLEGWLDWHRDLTRFAMYWLVCGWLTILAALLAVYDLLLLRVQHHILRRELRARFLGEQHRHEPADRDGP